MVTNLEEKLKANDCKSKSLVLGRPPCPFPTSHKLSNEWLYICLMKERNIRREDRRRGERKKWASFKLLAPHEQCSHKKSWVWFLFLFLFIVSS